MNFNEILIEAQVYVSHFLTEELSPALCFHNLNHTREVMDAAIEIGQQSELTEEEMGTVRLAACFHDTGYAATYVGHEEESIKIAKGFLAERNFEKELTLRVLHCIEATRLPQTPKTLEAKVICDADFYHLTKPSYSKYENTLRRELEGYLHRTYTDKEWIENNLTLFAKHHYWTAYGTNVLQKFKEVNLARLEKAENVFRQTLQ